MGMFAGRIGKWESLKICHLVLCVISLPDLSMDSLVITHFVALL